MLANDLQHMSDAGHFHYAAASKAGNGWCEYVELVAFVQEILDFADSQTRIKNSGNYGDTTLWFPVYHARNLKLAGAYTESAILTHDDDECVITGVYNFDYLGNPAIAGKPQFQSSLTQQSSCAANFGAVTGGTGRFSCATGFQAFYEDLSSDHFVALKLFLCKNKCGGFNYDDYW